MPRICVKQLSVGENAIDAHGHVNNQDYLRWMEEIAIEHSTAQGWPMERYLKSGASWFVRSHSIEYLRPALLWRRRDRGLHLGIGDGGPKSPRRTLFEYEPLADAKLLRNYVADAEAFSSPFRTMRSLWRSLAKSRASGFF